MKACFIPHILSRSHLAALLLLALIYHPERSAAQDLHVYYDLFADSTYFMKDGKYVRDPKIKKGDRLVVHFTEYNPYIYRAEAQVEQVQSSDAFGGSAGVGALSSLIPGMSAFLTPPVESDSAGTGPVTFLDVPLLKIGEQGIRLKDLFNNSRGTAELLNQAKMRVQEMTLLQADMERTYNEIQSIEKSERAARLAMEYLDKLLYNTQMRPSLIKRIATEYLDLVFMKKYVGELNITDAFAWQDQPATKNRLIQELRAKQEEYLAQSAALTPLARELGNLDAGAELSEFAHDLSALDGQNRLFQRRLENYLSRLEKSTDQELSLPQLMALHLKFRELLNQSFTYEVAVQMEKEAAIVTATFTPWDSLTNGASRLVASPKQKTLKLETHGGLRVSTGFGVAFSRFFEPAQQFTVREGVIVAEKEGIVQPAIATFIHFYAHNRAGTSLAGTFGIGIPLGGGEEFQSINFFLGPSLLFGRSQRIVLTAGITAGPTDRLGRGYAEGDAFDLNNGDLPIKRGYELGYFAGISFNFR